MHSAHKQRIYWRHEFANEVKLNYVIISDTQIKGWAAEFNGCIWSIQQHGVTTYVSSRCYILFFKTLFFISLKVAPNYHVPHFKLATLINPWASFISYICRCCQHTRGSIRNLKIKWYFRNRIPFIYDRFSFASNKGCHWCMCACAHGCMCICLLMWANNLTPMNRAFCCNISITLTKRKFST